MKVININLEVLIAVGLLFIVFYFAKNINNNSAEKLPDKLPYHAKHILTKPEYSFYKVLRKVCDQHNCLICPKVGLKDIASVSSKENYSHWFYKISSKHVDFIITDNNLKVLFAIELDDKSHNREDVKEKDKFKDLFFKSIEIPLYRITLNYTEDSIENMLFPKKTEHTESVSTI